MSIIERTAKRIGRPADSAAFEQGSEPNIAKSSHPSSTEKARPVELETPRRNSQRAKVTVELDLERLSRLGYLTPKSSAGRLVEQYRVLKRALLNKALDNRKVAPGQTNPVIVTSALPKEGKTFTAFNLAMSLVMERDISVLLVDADLSQRSLSVLAGLEGARGLGELLVNEQLDPAELIVKTNVPKLSFIAAGQAQSHATELLSSMRMRCLLQDLAERYSDRLLLLDSAPVLGTSLGTALCDLAALILFVVEEGRTPQLVLKDAISQFDEEKAIGLVLNKSSRSQNAGYSSYYGNY
jgi:receptor protein-tyrosine kinase